VAFLGGLMASPHRLMRARAHIGLIITPDDPGNFSSLRVSISTISDDGSIASCTIDTEAKDARITRPHLDAFAWMARTPKPLIVYHISPEY
jgi:hypothetical protein